LGSVYFKQGDSNQAKEYWEKSLVIQSNQPQVKSYLQKIPVTQQSVPTSPQTPISSTKKNN
jgi:hypothetical protein